MKSPQDNYSDIFLFNTSIDKIPITDRKSNKKFQLTQSFIFKFFSEIKNAFKKLFYNLENKNIDQNFVLLPLYPKPKCIFLFVVGAGINAVATVVAKVV